MPSLVSPALPEGVLSGHAQPVLGGESGLELRPWSPGHAAFLVAAYADADIRRWHVRTMDLEEARAWIGTRAERWAGDCGADWVVTRDRAAVGRVGLRTVNLAGGSGEVAYWVAPAARGRGVAVDALTTLSGWALEAVGFHRLDLHHSVTNPASCRVAERCGYVAEGTARSSVLHADGWHDMHLHAIVRQACR